MSLSLTAEQTRVVLSNPSFLELTSARARLRWGLSIVTLVMFFGFIGLISVASSTLGKSMSGGNVPLGMAVALGMIALVVALTGYYVRRSNTYFDGLAQRVRRECCQ